MKCLIYFNKIIKYVEDTLIYSKVKKIIVPKPE